MDSQSLHPGEQLPRPLILHGSLSEHWATLCRLNNSGHGIFVMVNEGNLAGRTASDVMALRALFIDDDAKGPEAVVFTEEGVAPFTSLAPTWSVESSEGKWHHYFALRKGEPLGKFSSAQATLAAHFGTDTSVKDLCRVMRLPGFLHQKARETPQLVRLTRSCNARYSVAEVVAAYPGPSEPNPTIQDRRPPVSASASNRDGDRVERARRYASKLPPAIEGEGGNNATFALCCAVVRGFDLSDDQALTALAEWNAGCRPPWDEGGLRGLIQHARAYGTEEVGARLRVRNDREKPAKPNFAMLCDVLRNDEQRAVACGRFGQLRMDERTRELYLGGRPFGGDTDVSSIRENIALRLVDHVFGKEDVHDALALVASEHSFNPVKEYLVGLKWDGVGRLAQVQRRVLGVGDEGAKPLADVLLRKFFIASVARALQPGCKVDTVLILTGRQGARKSTFFRILAGEWFSDASIEIGNKDALLVMGQRWIIEWPELDALTRARNHNAAKAFITQQMDTFRPPYARTAITQPRCSIFVGSTNDDDFLTDPTGNRRFWPVAVGAEGINLELLAEWRDQLWAEAVTALNAGEAWHLDEEEDAKLRREHGQYEREDPWLAAIAAYLANRSEVRVETILTKCFEMLISNIKRDHQMRVAACLKSLGWEQGPRRGAHKLRTYVPGPTAVSAADDVSLAPPPQATPVAVAARELDVDEDEMIQAFMQSIEAG